MEKEAHKSSLNWLSVLQGQLALSGRPGKQAFFNLPTLGVTHVFTLLSEREGAKQVKESVEQAGMQWIWLPLDGAALPDSLDLFDKWLPVIDSVVALLQTPPTGEGDQVVKPSILVHCAAGIHRTGMVAACILRRVGLDADHTAAGLKQMRERTAAEVTDARLCVSECLIQFCGTKSEPTQPHVMEAGRKLWASTLDKAVDRIAPDRKKRKPRQNTKGKGASKSDHRAAAAKAAQYDE